MVNRFMQNSNSSASIKLDKFPKKQVINKIVEREQQHHQRAGKAVEKKRRTSSIEMKWSGDTSSGLTKEKKNLLSESR